MNKESFIKELKALLDKYDATIAFECGSGSDLHGIYDEKLIVYSGIAPNEETLLEVDGMWMDRNSI